MCSNVENGEVIGLEIEVVTAYVDHDLQACDAWSSTMAADHFYCCLSVVFVLGIP